MVIPILVKYLKFTALVSGLPRNNDSRWQWHGQDIKLIATKLLAYNFFTLGLTPKNWEMALECRLEVIEI